MLKFLRDRAVIGTAIALLLSNTMLDLTNGATDDLVMPLVDQLVTRLGGNKLTEKQWNVLGATLKVGRFLKKLVRFIAVVLLVMFVIRVAKLK